MSTNSTQKRHAAKSKGVPTNPINVDASSSGSQPAPPKEGRVQGSTPKSSSETNTSRAQRRAVNNENSSQSSTGPTTSQTTTQSTEPGQPLVKPSTASSKSPPALTAQSHTTTSSKPSHDQVGVENPTERSHTKVNLSKASQGILNSADSPPTGRETTTTSQRENIETENTTANVRTASSKSPPAPPEQVGSEGSTADSRSTTHTSNESQCTPNGADSPRSSGTSNTTITSHEEQSTEHEKTHLNTPAKDRNPSKNQSADGNVDAPAQGSSLSSNTSITSENVKDGSGSDHLPSHVAHSHHGNQEVMNRNQNSDNPSQPCDGTATHSIEEKIEVDHSTEGANKRKASDPTQAENGQATTFSMGEDVGQQLAKYEEDIRGLKAKILSMETFASQKARDYGEMFSSLETIVNQQKQEYKEEIESFRAKISTMEHKVNTERKREIECLEGKHEKEIQRLEALVVDLGKQTSKDIERLQAKILSTGHEANTEHKQEIEHLEKKHEKEIERLEKKHEKEIQRLEGNHEKEIQRLQAIIVDKGEQALKCGESERLQPKVSGQMDAKQPKTRQARDSTKSPDEKPMDWSQPPRMHAAKHSSTAPSQKINSSDQEPGIENEQNRSLPSTSASDKQKNIPPSQTVTPKADSLHVTDVANVVKALNAEIGQIVNLLTESLPDPEPSAGPASDIAFDELHDYLGPWLCDKLRENSEPDPLITQLALQTGLANACSSVVNDPPFWCDGSVLQTLYRKMAEKEGQAADKWKTKVSNYLGYFDLPQCEDASRKYLTQILLKLAAAAVGGTLNSGESLLSQYNQQVEVIAKLAARLHKIITEEVISSELMTYTVPCDTEFDASQMEDTENDHLHGKVICTQDMGLLCRKRVGPKRPRGSWGVAMKAKVILTSALEA